MITLRRTREQIIRECLATFPGCAAYPSQIADRLGWRHGRVHADMRRMAAKERGIHKIHGYTREVTD